MLSDRVYRDQWDNEFYYVAPHEMGYRGGRPIIVRGTVTAALVFRNGARIARLDIEVPRKVLAQLYGPGEYAIRLIGERRAGDRHIRGTLARFYVSPITPEEARRCGRQG